MSFRERYLNESAGHYENHTANRIYPIGPGFQGGLYNPKEYKPKEGLSPGATLALLSLLGAGAIAAGQ